MQNPFYTMPLGYMNALIASVTGDEESSKLAKEYLANVDPDTWSDQLDKLDQSPQRCGVIHSFTRVIHNP